MKINGVEVTECEHFDKYWTLKCDGKNLCEASPNCEFKRKYKEKEEKQANSLKYLSVECEMPEDIQVKYKDSRGRVENFFRIVTKATSKKEAANKVNELLGVNVLSKNFVIISNEYERSLCDEDENNTIITPCNYRNSNSYLLSEELK